MNDEHLSRCEGKDEHPPRQFKRGSRWAVIRNPEKLDRDRSHHHGSRHRPYGPGSVSLDGRRILCRRFSTRRCLGRGDRLGWVLLIRRAEIDGWRTKLGSDVDRVGGGWP